MAIAMQYAIYRGTLLLARTMTRKKALAIAEKHNGVVVAEYFKGDTK